MTQNVATEQLHHDWVKGLAAIPSRDFTLENVQDYIVRHSVRPETSTNIATSQRATTLAISSSRTKFRVHDHLLGGRQASRIHTIAIRIAGCPRLSAA